jgi:protein TonB
VKTGVRGIAHFAPLLLASLLLHLAVILVATGAGKRDAARQQLSLNMVVEYLEDVNRREVLPYKEIQRHVTAPGPKQVVTQSEETAPIHYPVPIPVTGPPVPQNALWSGVPPDAKAKPVENPGQRISSNVNAPSAGANSAAVTGRQVAAPPGLTRRNSDTASTPTQTSLQRRNSYQSEIKRLIEDHKEYPIAARKSGREGGCQRRFVLDRNGSLKRVEALSSCGHIFLDEAATRAITAVGKFPPLPTDFKEPEEAFTITMTFTLARQ